MAYSIPTSRPQALTVGATWIWDCSDDGFPPDEGWSRTASFLGQESFTITATVVDGHYRFSLTPDETIGYAAGDYRVVEQVELGSEKYTVAAGWCTLAVDPATASSDQRTHAEKMLAAIEAVLEGRVTDDIESYSIAGRSLQKIPVRELMQFRAAYADQVRRMRRGTAGYENVRVRFVPVT